MGDDKRGSVRPRSYRGTRPRFASSTLMSLRTTPPLHARQATCGGAPCFPKAPSGCHTDALPQRSKEGAERPGDGCPCVGAEEICGVPPRCYRYAARTITAFPSGAKRPSFSKRNRASRAEQESTKEAPPPTSGDSASFVRVESAEKLSLPHRTQPGSAHARGRHQPDRG